MGVIKRLKKRIVAVSVRYVFFVVVDSISKKELEITVIFRKRINNNVR